MKTKADYLLEAKVALNHARTYGSEMVNMWDSDFTTALLSLITCLKVKNLDTNYYEDIYGNLYKLYESSCGTGTRITYIENN